MPSVPVAWWWQKIFCGNTMAYLGSIAYVLAKLGSRYGAACWIAWFGWCMVDCYEIPLKWYLQLSVWIQISKSVYWCVHILMILFISWQTSKFSIPMVVATKKKNYTTYCSSDGKKFEKAYHHMTKWLI